MSDETALSQILTGAELADLQLRDQKNYLSYYLNLLTQRTIKARNYVSELGLQFGDADALYDESQYEQLRRHLTTLVLVRPYHLSLLNRLPRMGFTAVQIVARAWLTDVSRLNVVQARLIDGVMRRRHRIMFATKGIPNRGPPSKAEEQLNPDISLEAPRTQHQKELETHDDGAFPTCSPDHLEPQPRNTSPQVTPTEPSAAEAYSRIIAIQDYPPRPEFMAEATPRICHFCGKRLSNTELSSDAAWRSHVARDLQPYTCVLERCTNPTEFFLTSADWIRHMMAEHLDSVRSQFPDRILLDINSSQGLEYQRRINLQQMRCPLCNERSRLMDIQFNDHIAEHIHSFSLQALPWDNEALLASPQTDSSAMDLELERLAPAAAEEPTNKTESMAALESIPSNRLPWINVQESLKMIYPSKDFDHIPVIQRNGRYSFRMHKRLLSSEKNNIWHVARSRRNRKYNQTRVRSKRMFHNVIYLGIAPPPDGPIHLGSIVSDIVSFGPLGSVANRVVRPPGAYTATQQQGGTIKAWNSRTREHIELDARQVNELLLEPSDDDILAAMEDPGVKTFIRRRARVDDRPVVFMVTGLMVAKDGVAVKKQITRGEVRWKGEGWSGEKRTRLVVPVNKERVVTEQWMGDMVVGIRVHQIRWRETNTRIKECNGRAVF
ncbi:hypothetical protein GGR51DRAFT_554706 [Nemania sp. FL0031]|nr:hypothetical protein GGR51DRAFT_554706 [Nemania sp. FL0031]